MSGEPGLMNGPYGEMIGMSCGGCAMASRRKARTTVHHALLWGSLTKLADGDHATSDALTADKRLTRSA